MPRESIKQAACGNCDLDADDSKFTVTDKSMEDTDDGPEIEYEVRHTCGHTGTITLTDEGVSASDGINHDDASWNQGDDDGN